MYFIPLSQSESVEMVINALRMAGGAADCSTCPAVRACEKQCLAVAAAVAKMVNDGTLPTISLEKQPETGGGEPEPPEPPASPPGGPRLKRIK